MNDKMAVSLQCQVCRNMPSARAYCAAVVYKETLFVIGGCDKRGVPVSSVESFNLHGKKWKRLSNLPTARAGLTAAVVKSHIITVGGVLGNQVPSDAVEVYDINNQSWIVKHPLAEGLSGMSCIVIDDLLYIIGGVAPDTNPRSCFSSYDLENDVWLNLPNLPTSRYATTSFLKDNQLFVLGGRQGRVPVDNFEVYNFETRCWSLLPEIPSKRVFAHYCLSGNCIYSVGGLCIENGRKRFVNVTEVYNIEAGEWIIGSEMACKRADFVLSNYKGSLIAAGGLNDKGPLKNVEIFDFDLKSWQPSSDLAEPLCAAACVSQETGLYMIGGLSVGGACSTIIKLL